MPTQGELPIGCVERGEWVKTCLAIGWLQQCTLVLTSLTYFVCSSVTDRGMQNRKAYNCLALQYGTALQVPGVYTATCTEHESFEGWQL